MNAKNAQKTLSFLFLLLLVLTSFSLIFTQSVQAQDLPIISDPSPEDGATIDNSDVELSVYVAQNDGHSLEVEFFEGQDVDGTLIDSTTVQDTGSGVRAYCPSNWTHEADDGEIMDWTVKVTDQSTNDYSTSTYQFTYSEDNAKPDEPSNPNPEDGATGLDTDTVTLEVDVSDPNGDDMDVTFYDASDDSEIDTDTGVSSDSTASVSWSGLEYDDNYYWYAKADDGLDSTQSSTWSFSTTNNGMPEIVNPSPEDGATNVDHSDGVELSVDISDPDGDSMDVEFIDYSDGSTIDSFTDQSNGTVETTWTGLDESTEYIWYVTADDGVGVSESSHYNFTTVEINSAPIVDERYPEDGAGDVDVDKNLQVSVEDPDGDDMVIEFYDASDHSIIKTISEAHDGIYSIEWNKTYNTTYEWYVVVSDPHTQTTESVWEFTTVEETTDDNTTEDNTTHDSTSGGSWTLSEGSSILEDNYNVLIAVIVIIFLIAIVTKVIGG